VDFRASNPWELKPKEFGLNGRGGYDAARFMGGL